MYNNKKILVLGAARSGISVCKTLIKLNCEVILNDLKNDKTDEICELEKIGVQVVLGSHPDTLLDNTIDYLVKNPGIRNDHKYVKLAEKLNIPVINEVEVAYNLLPNDVKIISITGTNGKTTTTTLTYNILHEMYKDKVHLAGNIGYPLTSILDKVKPGDIIVSEISCQQLANLDKFNPDIALLTNLSPAHIDFFGNYDLYKEIKIKLFRNQSSENISILNLDNSDSINYKDRMNGKLMYFSLNNKTNCYLENNNIYYNDEFIINRDDIFLKGNHNVSNCLSAVLISKILNVSNDVIVNVLKSFRGVEHRLELVDIINNRKFYNDTEATNIKCTQIALSAFNEPTIIFLGGLERGQDFNELTDYMKNVKLILAIGECRNRVKEFGDKLGIKTIVNEFLKDAFKDAYSNSSDGDIILLSPASASWDQYKECEIRGAEFKKYVKELKDESN